MSLIIHDFEAFIDEFQSVEDDIKMDAIGWNGRKITIIPLYNFILHNICPKAELMKLKPFDVIQFEETNIYESYLIVPLKVKQKYEVCLTNVDNTLKNFLLSYGLIKFEVTSTDGNAYLPPESLDIVEKGVKYGHKYFKDLYNCDRFNGIIVDHFFISQNFNKLFDNNFSEVGNNSEFKQIALLKDPRPPREVADKIISGVGSLAIVDVIVIILPHFFFFIPVSTNFVNLTTLIRFV